MCFKRGLIAVLCLLCAGICAEGQELVDRILVLVNDEVITLTDVKVAEAFGYFLDDEGQSLERDRILEQIINQRLLMQLMGESVVIQEEEVEVSLQILIDRLGRGRIEEEMEGRAVYPGWDAFRVKVKPAPVAAPKKRAAKRATRTAKRATKAGTRSASRAKRPGGGRRK